MNFSGLSVENIAFPDRKSIVKSDTHLRSIVHEVKKIDVNKVNFDGEDFEPHTKIIQKQKVYIWIRVYLKEEMDIKPETKVIIQYLGGKESIETYFMYFGKKGLERNKDGEIVNFNPEDDRRILCLLIDSERLDYNNHDIPYMKTLSPLSKHYKPDYFRKFDFTILLEDGTNLDFFDIEF